jgi:uncharacterized protein (TIGR02246 family)
MPLDSRDELTAFGKSYAEAWCSQAPEKVAAFFADDGSLTVNDGAAAVGRAAIAEVARGFMRAFPDLVVTMDEIARGAEGTKFDWTLTGTNDGPGGTGKRVCISGYELWQLNAAGLIEKSLGYFDAAEYDQQLKDGVRDRSGMLGARDE